MSSNSWGGLSAAVRSTLVLIKGAGDLASGVAIRLHRCGFPIVMTELPEPVMVRRTVSFGEAIYLGEMDIEGVVARRVPDVAAAHATVAAGEIPVLVDPGAGCRHVLAPQVLVDAVMAKENLGTSISDAPLVIALGPGFTAGQDCHAVIETNRGHWMGRVIWEGSAEPDTHTPGEVAGFGRERVLRAPVSGVFQAAVQIGDRVAVDQVVATVDGKALRAPFPGVVRGLIRSGLPVVAELKVGDIDPRAEKAHCLHVSDKGLALGGAVLEAILTEAGRDGGVL